MSEDIDRVRGSLTAPERQSRWTRSDVIAVSMLVGIGMLLFGVPAVFGHIVAPGDDLTQNFPLRVLVGHDLVHGHLPLLNPNIWSGAPLLGGWNAGAADPFTWLFAILPGSAAWALNQVIISALAGVGTYVFLRATGLRSVASFLGALTFGDAGAMVAQTSHIGLLAGMSFAPWILYALLRLSNKDIDRRGPWILLLAAAGALCVLAGEPRAVDDVVIITAAYAVWRGGKVASGQDTRAVIWFAVAIAIGLVLATALSAVQWAPGLASVGTSQRGAHSTLLYNSGSLPIRWLSLLFVPDILGGSGSWHQPGFLPTYNLTEVTGYVGILPIVAAVALPWTLRRKRRPANQSTAEEKREGTFFAWLPDWVVWEFVALAGVVLALGSNTPLGQLLAHIPLFGNQRLQSRNILITDFALSVLLAFWVDRLLHGQKERGAKDTATIHPQQEVEIARTRWSEVIPAAVAGVLVIIAAAWGAGWLSWLGVTGVRLDATGSLRPWLAPSFVLSVLAVIVVVKGRRWPTRDRAIAVTSFVVVDIFAFALTSVVAVGVGLGAPAATAASTGTTSSLNATTATTAASTPVPPTASSMMTKTVPVATIERQLHAKGRFAVFDPGLVDPAGLSSLGVPDLNSLNGTPSIQGYGSIVDATYAMATGTHTATGNGQNSLATTAIGNGDLDELDTSLLFTTPNYLVNRVGPGLPSGEATNGRRMLSAMTNSTWYLGPPSRLLSATFDCTAAPGNSATPSTLTVSIVNSFGVVVPAHGGSPVPCGSHVHVALPSIDNAVGLVIRADNAQVTINAPTISSASEGVLVADGTLQSDVSPPRWHYAAIDGRFMVFRNKKADPPLRLAPLSGTGSKVPQGTLRSIGTLTLPMKATVTTPHGASLVRSVADIPGWDASWQGVVKGKPEGSSRSLKVLRHDLVQAVVLPAGAGIVSWNYDPPGWQEGQILTLLGLIALFALFAWSLLVRGPVLSPGSKHT